MHHAKELATYLEIDRRDGHDDGVHLGPTDAALAALALRHFAGRRRGIALALASINFAAVALPLLVTVAIGTIRS